MWDEVRFRTKDGFEALAELPNEHHNLYGQWGWFVYAWDTPGKTLFAAEDVDLLTAQCAVNELINNGIPKDE